MGWPCIRQLHILSLRWGADTQICLFLFPAHPSFWCLDEMTPSITSAIGGIAVLILTQVIYRLFFHPLSRIPGPRLAAASYLPEIYHDIFRGGMYMWEIEKMHSRYGPIVRINPREVHIKDPAFYDEIYASGRRIRQKNPAFTIALLTPGAMASTNDHEQHRLRRGFLNNFFSKRSVMRLESIIQEKVCLLRSRFASAYQEKTVLNLPPVFAALTADVITHYCHGQSLGYLTAPDFKSDTMEALDTLFRIFHVNRFLPILAVALRRPPFWLIEKLGIPVSTFGDMIEARLRSRKRAMEALNNQKKSHHDPTTIFEALTADSIPAVEKIFNRLQDEASVLFGAGTETTARTLSVAGFYLAKEKRLLGTLRSELKDVIPSPTSQPSWSQLERLPFLTGVVHEALRLSYGLSGRLARIAPTEVLQYKEFGIPPGTPVSQAVYFVHHDPSIFPSPETFDPRRWIQATEQGVNLRKYLVSFNKGSRQCLGMNLAYAQMYLTLAMFARNFDLDLVDTTEDNIRLGRDLCLPYPAKGRFSVRIQVTGLVED
ncbi:benzoate 4-monooxygenase cytochrome P450 [Penicillium capsulatum]|uniref:Benzoate 4-monooxygenase cytochrome P450 n=1 Tax=Penicillium capsulatum TaxID=69766 RepID=A0A9W9LG73_9EURO|nr:benzoate 4-monooxygenase cytochrome P450 [Penicillium capsulatum]KAJ6106143.1 benzoate 4-monooxygenase cytochrome P450 [Penicillium capsulatum]